MQRWGGGKQSNYTVSVQQVSRVALTAVLIRGGKLLLTE